MDTSTSIDSLKHLGWSFNSVVYEVHKIREHASCFQSDSFSFINPSFFSLKKTISFSYPHIFCIACSVLSIQCFALQHNGNDEGNDASCVVCVSCLKSDYVSPFMCVSNLIITKQNRKLNRRNDWEMYKQLTALSISS